VERAQHAAREAQKKIAVEIHGAAHVEQHDQARQHAHAPLVYEIDRRAAVAQARADGAAQVDAPAVTRQALPPLNAPAHAARQTLGEIFDRADLARVVQQAKVRLRGRFLPARAAARSLLRRVACIAGLRPIGPRDIAAAAGAAGAEAALLRHGRRLDLAGLAALRQPIGVEELVEALPLVRVTAQEAAQSPAQAFPLEQGAAFGDAQRIQPFAHAHLEALPAQQREKLHDPLDQGIELACGRSLSLARAHWAFAASRCMTSGVMASRSSRVFSRQTSVCMRSAGSSSSFFTLTRSSAATQSSVSETPGFLRKSMPRSACMKATTCPASRSPTCGRCV